MNLIWQALWFIVAVSLLVTVHEFGHYWVARRLGFKVLRFSIGFGRPLLSWVWGKDRTEYVIATIPLGGYVKVLDEREGPVAPSDLQRSFTRRPPWQRILMLLAGPLFNILFAILVLWGMLWASGVKEVKPVIGVVAADSVAARGGVRSGDQILAVNQRPTREQRDVVFDLLDAVSSGSDVALTLRDKAGDTRTATLHISSPEERRKLTDPSASMFKGLGFQFWEPSVPAVLRAVEPGGPAAAAGLKTGDQILAIDAHPVDLAAFQSRIEESLGRTILIRYRRAGVENSARVVVGSDTVAGRAVGRIKVSIGGPPGFEPQYPPGMVTHTPLSAFDALDRAAGEAWGMTVLQGRLFWRMVMGQVSLKNLSGPLSIAEFAGESAEAGVSSFLGFLVLISLSLGFLNLLPIPILDGGQIVFQLAEWLKGSPVSDRAQAFGQQVGIALLILLMGVALFNDITRQLG
jgi:regulator of sigma E protease